MMNWKSKYLKYKLKLQKLNSKNKLTGGSDSSGSSTRIIFNYDFFTFESNADVYTINGFLTNVNVDFIRFRNTNSRYQSFKNKIMAGVIPNNNQNEIMEMLGIADDLLQNPNNIRNPSFLDKILKLYGAELRTGALTEQELFFSYGQPEDVDSEDEDMLVLNNRVAPIQEDGGLGLGNLQGDGGLGLGNLQGDGGLGLGNFQGDGGLGLPPRVPGQNSEGWGGLAGFLERRYGLDGELYTLSEFIEYYDNGQELWDQAQAEVRYQQPTNQFLSGIEHVVAPGNTESARDRANRLRNIAEVNFEERYYADWVENPDLMESNFGYNPDGTFNITALYLVNRDAWNELTDNQFDDDWDFQ
jgi:hypothetical protein